MNMGEEIPIVNSEGRSQGVFVTEGHRMLH